MNNTMHVGYDPKTRRLVLKAPFHMVDVCRGFPSRRFNPKDKTWRVPLIKGNIQHLTNTRHIYDYAIDAEAQAAIDDRAQLMAKPTVIPFPGHVYDFTSSATGYLPMEHQTRMLDSAWGLHGAAWVAKMGTGKTFAGIHIAFARWAHGQIDAVVIICPSTLRKTWEKEFKKYATDEYDFRIHETKAKWFPEFCKAKPRDRLQVLAVSVEGLGVSEASYDSVCGFFGHGKRVLTICDESSRIKNPEAKRTVRTIELGSVSEYRMILNGTPIALGIEDLWSQYEFLDPNIIGMGDYWAYKTRYIVMGGYVNKFGKPTKVVGVQNVDELMDAIIPYTCEVGKDVLSLPPKIMVQRWVEITPRQRHLLRLIVKGSTGDPDDPIIEVENSLEKMLRCRQVVGGWLPKGEYVEKVIDGVPCLEIKTTMVPLDVNPKLDSLLELIDDLLSLLELPLLEG